MAEATDKTPQAAAGSAGIVLPIGAGIVLVGALAAFYFLPATLPAYARWIALVVGLAVAVGMFAVSQVGRAMIDFIVVSRVELRKMVWPTMEETRRTTILVIAFVLILGAFFWVIDAMLGWGSRQLFGGGV